MAGDSVDDAARPADGEGEARPAQDPETANEDRYKARIGIALAVLVVLGAWITVLKTDASTNEASTARRATRLGAQAETANVLEAGANAAIRDITAEKLVFSMRDAFTIDAAAAREAGVTVDASRAADRLAMAQAEVDAALSGSNNQATLAALAERVRRLSLQQSEAVSERVTWNARSSQYDSVLATLAVAIFLVGFTVVVRRKARPPLAVPALLLAVYCFGWAIYIYEKPVPDVAPETIEATARGQAELATSDADNAIESFSNAIGEDSHYQPAFSGRGLARFVATNPDLLNTLAFTDTSAAALDPVRDDLKRGLELGGDDSAAPLTVAGYAAIAANEYDTARELLGRAVELNDLTPGAQFALSAVEVARGDESAAREWRSRAAAQLTSTESTDRNQELVAQYFTLLEWVAQQRPQQASLANALRDDTAAQISEHVAGRRLRPGSAAGKLEIGALTFMDDTTTIAISTVDTPDDATVAVFGYELPAPDGTFVQPSELGYVGPAASTGRARTLYTPRACAPVAYRFDLYVEGRLVDSVDEPGVAPTC